jgi:replication initiation protein RepC
MRTDTNTGWRKPGPIFHAPSEELEASKKELFEAMRLAVQARKLRPSARHVLDHMVGCYGGQKIRDRFLVWPSNEFLMERTGLVERSIRYALADLIKQGLIEAHESANGKRFAIHATNGQIIDAYGFDLSPLLLLQAEHQTVVERIRIVRRVRDTQMDQITICRRSVREILIVLEEWSAGSTDLTERFERLSGFVPRRDSNSPLEETVGAWQKLKDDAMEVYNTASGGNSCRLIKDNKNAPDQSCSNGSEIEGRKNLDIRFSDVLEACPDAVEVAGGITRPEQLMAEAGRLRGMQGVSISGWVEAREKLGAAAAVAFFVALQIHCNDQRNRGTIKNFGAFFRSMVRKIHTGDMSLAQELYDLKRRRHH